MTTPIAKSYVQPTPGDVHVDQTLTSLSTAYMQDASAFIARQVFPIIPVAKQSDLFWTYDRGTFNKDLMELRAPGAPTPGITHTLSRDSYFARVWGLHEDIADQVRANTDSPLSMEQDAVDIITRAAMLRMEREWIGTAMTSSAWNIKAAGANSDNTTALDANGAQRKKWSDATSDPIQLVRAARRTMQKRTGYMPNVMILGPTVYDTLVDHPDIIARLDRGQTPGGPAMAEEAALARLFKIDNILTTEAIYNSAAEGQDTETQFVSDSDVLMLYRPDRPGWKVPSAGYTFVWNGYAGAPTEGARMKRFRLEEIASDRIEGEMAFTCKITGSDLGVYFSSMV